MAKTTTRQSYQGRAGEPVSWEALLRIFDTIWGEAARSLPKYPQIIGAVHASWHDALNTKYEADSLDEVSQAYEQHKTSSISFSGFGQGLRCDFKYCPVKAEASIYVQASDLKTAEQIINAVRQEFPLVAKYVFISYDAAEFELADYMKKVLEKRLVPGVSVFVAKRDIKPGANPLKVMLEEQLLHAEALVALCSANPRLRRGYGGSHPLCGLTEGWLSRFLSIYRRANLTARSHSCAREGVSLKWQI